MSEIPEEIRCDFDAAKPCPLRAAVYAIEQARSAPEGEHLSPKELDALLEETTAPLSKADLARFYAVTDPSGPSQDIRPGTCRTGPSRWVPLVGKKVCGAASVNYVRKSTVPPPETP